MQKKIILILSILVFSGCDIYLENKDLNLSDKISFEISSHLATGMNIKSIVAFDQDNYYFSAGSRIISVENSLEKQTDVSSEVMAMAWNKDDKSLWYGTKSSGLARLKNGKMTYFTKNSDHLPRDLVSDLVCDDNGTVWFNCSAHLLGGLGCYRDDEFHFYTPDNSVLPDNLIKSIACSGNRIYVATGGYVNQQKVVKIDNNRWKLLPVEGYYLMDMDVDSEGNVYVIDDVSLSSSSTVTNKIYLYDYNSCRNILPDFSRFDFWPYQVKTDLRNYLWVSKSGPENSVNLTVFDGENWHEAPAGFPDVFIYCIAIDKNNAIWLGTTDGIFILNQ